MSAPNADLVDLIVQTWRQRIGEDASQATAADRWRFAVAVRQQLGGRRLYVRKAPPAPSVGPGRSR